MFPLSTCSNAATESRWRLSAAILGAALALSAPQSVGAAMLTHTVKPGETLEYLAQHYYGEAWKAAYLETHNRVDAKEPLRPGLRIEIPTSWTRTVRRGDSAAALAQRFLGDTERYQALIEFNGIRNPRDLAPGRELLMPFHLRYTVVAGDSFSGISRRFYRGPRLGSMLQRYNGGIRALQPGQVLVVPIFDRDTLAANSRGPPPPPSGAGAVTEAAPSNEPPLENEEQAIAAAMKAYNEGDFERACTAFENLVDGGRLSLKGRGTAIRQLGFCRVAYGDKSGARDYFRTWLELDPSAQLDPITTSPKVLAVFQEVRAEAGARARSDASR